jgi:Coenzyme PQQ synthesis protein D (PqqD)
LIWYANSDVLMTDLGDEVVLLHAAESQMYRLDAVARVIWARLPATNAELLESVVHTFEVAPQRAEADLQALLTQLAELKIVHQE